jgi:ADP-ribose pyrophosphatase YjhB (NUDIX family)
MKTINPNILNGVDLEYQPEKDVNEYEDRITTRVFVADKDNNIGLIKHVDMLFPPGGGVEEGETIFEASAREVIEELGVSSDPVKDLGILEQYHEKWMKKFIIHHVYATTEKQEVKVDYEDYDTNLERVWMNIEGYRILLEEYLKKKPDDMWAKGILYFLKEL